jgi:hypothetical protein
MEPYHRWQAIRLSNGFVELVAVPEIGGRILQLRLGDQEYFYVNPRYFGRAFRAANSHPSAGWRNYGGSKVWPAPQGWSSDAEWPGPPDPVLDGGPYTWDILAGDGSEPVLVMTSPPDAYTGLTLSREICLVSGAASVRIRHRMRNSSLRPVRWAIWQVTQQRVSPGFAVFVPAHAYRQTFGDEAYDPDNASSHRGLFKLRYMNRITKFAVQAEEGWISSLHGEQGLLLAEMFKVFRGEPYVDDSPVALWVNGAGSYTTPAGRVDSQDAPDGCDAYVETEIFSPLVKLDPGDEYSFDISWHCARVEGESVESLHRLGAMVRGLRVEREGNGLMVSASFGVFQKGAVELASIDKNGQILSAEAMGEANPLKACQFKKRIPLVADLNRLSLRFRNLSGELLGNLDSAVLHPSQGGKIR